MTEQTYQVLLVDRLKGHFLPDETIGPDDHFVYEWDHGSERVYLKHDNGGSSEFRGVYHPNGICDTGTPSDSGICIWCGRTLFGSDWFTHKETT